MAAKKKNSLTSKETNLFTPKETKAVVMPNGKTKTFVKGTTYFNVSADIKKQIEN